MTSSAATADTAIDLTCSSEMETQTFIVCAEWLLDDGDLEEEDRDAVGGFLVKVPAHLPEGLAAACALGIYHSVVAIKNLSDFEITVRDEEHENEVGVDYGTDMYALANSFKELWHYVEDQYEGGNWE